MKDPLDTGNLLETLAKHTNSCPPEILGFAMCRQFSERESPLLLGRQYTQYTPISTLNLFIVDCGVFKCGKSGEALVMSSDFG
jgi:hypothetical protein